VKNSDTKNHQAAVSAVKPVRPPSRMPAALSMNAATCARARPRACTRPAVWPAGLGGRRARSSRAPRATPRCPAQPDHRRPCPTVKPRPGAPRVPASPCAPSAGRTPRACSAGQKTRARARGSGRPARAHRRGAHEAADNAGNAVNRERKRLPRELLVRAHKACARARPRVAAGGRGRFGGACAAMPAAACLPPPRARTRARRPAARAPEELGRICPATPPTSTPWSPTSRSQHNEPAAGDDPVAAWRH